MKLHLGAGYRKYDGYLNVDYDIVKFKYNIDPKYQHLLVDMKPGSQEETDFSTMLREKNNMIVDVEFTMVVLKDE